MNEFTGHSKEDWIEILSDFIQENFVSDGKCADAAIHDTDGHNPHAHIMLTVRPLDENGKWDEYGPDYSLFMLADSTRQARDLLDEEAEERWLERELRQQEKEQQR